MVSCCVLDCGVTYSNNPNKQTFHRFPKNPLMREKWVRIIKRVGWEPHNNSVVCSRHFKHSCFIQRNRRRILKKESMPTEDVPEDIQIRRPVSSYVLNRDRGFSPEPSTSQAKPLSPRKKKLIIKCSKLKEKIKQKQQNIRNLRAKAKRLKNKLVQADELIQELQKRPDIKDHFNEITAACSNETLQYWWTY